jgi:hypothetical protein
MNPPAIRFVFYVMEVRMRAVLFATAAVIPVLFAGAPLAFQSTGTSVERTFAKAGRIRMTLAAAEYRISGRSEDKIRVEWRTDNPEDAARVKADIQVNGTGAAIATTGVKHGLHFTIEVPTRSDIEIDLTAGDLQVRGIEGSKRVEAWAGDVSIDVGPTEQYRNVEASVRAGDLTALPFQVSKGGLLRSFSWTGKGPYSLRVKLFAGDLTLR